MSKSVRDPLVDVHFTAVASLQDFLLDVGVLSVKRLRHVVLTEAFERLVPEFALSVVRVLFERCDSSHLSDHALQFVYDDISSR